MKTKQKTVNVLGKTYYYVNENVVTTKDNLQRAIKQDQQIKNIIKGVQDGTTRFTGFRHK